MKVPQGRNAAIKAQNVFDLLHLCSVFTIITHAQ